VVADVQALVHGPAKLGDPQSASRRIHPGAAAQRRSAADGATPPPPITWEVLGGDGTLDPAARVLANILVWTVAVVLTDAGLAIVAAIPSALGGLAVAGAAGGVAGAVILAAGAVVGAGLAAAGIENLIFLATGSTPISDALGIRIPIVSRRQPAGPQAVSRRSGSAGGSAVEDGRDDR